MSDGNKGVLRQGLYTHWSSVSSTKSYVNIYLVKVWTVIDRLSIIGKSDLLDKIEWDFIRAAVESILVNGCVK